ncbi:peptide-binding protein [candidate division CSSED10-310 bacterium]|uniref:Peptide-binding protein n=1 Tax=candidate division CSSED10-310 bacterium TaxID=2855610 RepID=A0ABV6YSJ1_UNCC1
MKHSTLKNTLIRELASDPSYLNPVLANDNPSFQVVRLIYDNLLDIDESPNSNLVGRLAEKWAVSEDKLTVTFYLRRGVTWHDGKPFTAEDVKFTFDTAMRDDIPALLMKSTVETLERVEVIDPHVVKFYFKHPFSPGLLNVGQTFIIPKHRLDDKGLIQEKLSRNVSGQVTFLTTEYNRKPIGTGAYIFQEWKTNQHIKLTANKAYWNPDLSPKIRNVTIKIIPNRTTAFNVLQKGNLDVFRARAIHYLHFARLTSLHQDFLAEKISQPSYYYIGWNMRSERPFFSDQRVRMAMTHALDRKAFVEKAGYGLAEILTGPFYYKSWAYNPNLEAIPFDLNKAAQLLDAAGWRDHDADGILDKNGRKFEFELLISSGSPTFAQLAAIVQANLKSLSIEVLIRVYEWSVYLSKSNKGEFDALIGGWVLGVDPDPYSIFHSSQITTGNNDIGYDNKKIDALLEAGRQEYDRQKRQQIYWQIHQIIHDEQPFTFVYTRMETYILSKRIEGYLVSPYGLFAFYPGPLNWSLRN